MTDVSILFDEFKHEFNRDGYADPRPFLSRAPVDDRATLEALIAAYLEAAPAASSDEAAYADSAARRLVSVLDEVVGESGGLWPQALPLLRRRARMRRHELVSRLTAELDLAGGEDLVRAAFHEMESGGLYSQDVQPPVLEALGRILGESADTLRSLGRRLGPPRAQLGTATAFARGGDSVWRPPSTPRAAESAPNDPKRIELERRVDQLFRGRGAGQE